jgi:predicted DNA-binding transcriptional regulator AlpA
MMRIAMRHTAKPKRAPRQATTPAHAAHTPSRVRAIPTLPSVPGPPEQLLTISEFMQQSKFSRSTVWRLLRDDPLLRRARVQLTKGRYRLRQSLIAEWINAKTEETEETT